MESSFLRQTEIVSYNWHKFVGRLENDVLRMYYLIHWQRRFHTRKVTKPHNSNSHLSSKISSSLTWKWYTLELDFNQHWNHPGGTFRVPGKSHQRRLRRFSQNFLSSSASQNAKSPTDVKRKVFKSDAKKKQKSTILRSLPIS